MRSGSATMVEPATTAMPARPAARTALDGRRTDRRQVDALVLAELGGLDQNAGAHRRADAAVAAQFRHARQHLVGAFRPFHRQHMIVGHDHGLADVEGTGGVEQRKAARDIGAVLLARHAGAERPGGIDEFGRNLLRADQPEAMLLEQPADARLQMIVAAPEQPHAVAASAATPARSGRICQSEGRTTEPIKATSRHPSCGCEPHETAKLADPGPMVRIGGDALRVGPSAQREQHDSPAAPHGRVRQRKRQASAAANDRERGLAVRRVGCRSLMALALAHIAASESPRRSPAAGIIGEPLAALADERHDFSDHRIVGESALVRSRRSANVPSPKNSIW